MGVIATLAIPCGKVSDSGSDASDCRDDSSNATAMLVQHSATQRNLLEGDTLILVRLQLLHRQERNDTWKTLNAVPI